MLDGEADGAFGRRHGARRTCDGGSCNFTPSFAAFVYSKGDGKKILGSFAGKCRTEELGSRRADG